VIVIIHGGSWSGGKKEDMNEFLGFLQTAFPNYPIANINYRLGNSSSPGYPKQIQDVDRALKFIESELQLNSSQFALFGGSAGAHLSMLYAYGFDPNGTVKAVVNVVGPVDFTDPLVSLNILYNKMLFSLIGPYFYLQNPKIYKEVSPVTYITSKSPPTIGFYGFSDPLIPINQGPILKRKLTKVGVANELNMYFGGHYFDWSDNDKKQMQTKIVNFLKLHFE
jgi:acetyl esterase/lipase